MANQVRRNLAVQIQTPGGDNPLTVEMVREGEVVVGFPCDTLKFVGKGGTPPYSFAVLTGTPPTGFPSLPSDGDWTGSIATTAGGYSFVIQIADSASQTRNQRFTIAVLPNLFIVRGTPTPGECLLAYSYQMIVRDAAGSTITSGYTLASGNLPDGLTINSAGLISGTPTFLGIGISYAVINVSSGGSSLDIQISIQVYTPLLGFSIDFEYTVLALQPIPLSPPTSFPTGGLPPYQYTWDNLEDYPWLTWSNNPLGFSGTPPFENIGFFQTITGTATDRLGATLPVQFKFKPIYAIAGVNGMVPVDRLGHINFVSSDGSIIIDPTTLGEIDLRGIATGAVVTINDMEPDSTGNIAFISSDSSIIIEPTTNGEIDLTASIPGLLAFGIDGGGIAIMPGTKSRAVRANGNGVITLSTIFLNPGASTGTCELDVLTSTYANYDTGTSIVASSPPVLTAAIKAEDSTLAGWSLNIVEGNFYWIEFISGSDITSITLNLAITKES
jgi:hypothetical protein